MGEKGRTSPQCAHKAVSHQRTRPTGRALSHEQDAMARHGLLRAMPWVGNPRDGPPRRRSKDNDGPDMSNEAIVDGKFPSSRGTHARGMGCWSDQSNDISRSCSRAWFNDGSGRWSRATRCPMARRQMPAHGIENKRGFRGASGHMCTRDQPHCIMLPIMGILASRSTAADGGETWSDVDGGRIPGVVLDGEYAACRRRNESVFVT